MSKILIVDDEQALAQNYVELFKLNGWHAEAVHDGKQALIRCQEAEFDAILLDMRMPGWDGLETMRRILDKLPDACIIVFTAYGEVSSAVKTLQSGAMNFVVKGVAFDDLLLIIQVEVKKKQALLTARENERQSRRLEQDAEIKRRIAEEQREAEKQRVESIKNLACGLSHQIKNRLSGLGLQVNLLKRKLVHGQNPQKYIDGIEEGLRLSDTCVSNLYKFAKLEGPEELEMESIQLLPILQDAIELASFKSSDSYHDTNIQIAIRTSADPTVFGNRDFLIEAFHCLIDNAIQASNGQGQVSVDVTSADGYGRVTIEDSGPGFDEQMLDTAHLPFTTSRNKTNVGFGLTFATQVIELCGGNLRYRNRDDSGARIEVSLERDTRGNSPKT